MPLLEGLDEELRLVHRRRLQGGHHAERRAPVTEDARHLAGAGHEPLLHRLHQREELGDVLQELRAEDAVGHRVEGLGRHRHDAVAVADGEPAQQPAGEEVGHALRRVEEVEGVAGGWRVDDDQVEAARGVQLVQALHRDVVVALHEPARDVLVDRVGQDGVAGLGVGRVAAHEVVPRLAGVEHGHPQLALGLEAGRGERLGRAPASRRCRRPRGRGPSASRRAGSTVSTSTRPPSSSVAIVPSAAATVVLPTPPDPQVTAISLAASSCSMDAGPLGASRRRGHQDSSSPRASHTRLIRRMPMARVNSSGT